MRLVFYDFLKKSIFASPYFRRAKLERFCLKTMHLNAVNKQNLISLQGSSAVFFGVLQKTTGFLWRSFWGVFSNSSHL